jgi:hypothetical protein
MIRVIYKDQSTGVVESHLLAELIRKGRIVAYHSMEQWIPVTEGSTEGVGPASSAVRSSEKRRRHTDW